MHFVESPQADAPPPNDGLQLTGEGGFAPAFRRLSIRVARKRALGVGWPRGG